MLEPIWLQNLHTVTIIKKPDEKTYPNKTSQPVSSRIEPKFGFRQKRYGMFWIKKNKLYWALYTYYIYTLYIFF